MLLENKVILITGVDCDIGPAVVAAAMREGAIVIGHANRRDSDQSRMLLDELACDVVLFGDLHIKSNIDTLWADAVAWRGRIDVLVNNADIYVSSPLKSHANWELGWKKNLSINLEAPAALCRHAIQHFEQRGDGIIINLDVRLTERSDTEHLAYHAAKGGLLALSQRISRSCARQGIQAFAVTQADPSTVYPQRNCLLAGDYLVSTGVPFLVGDLQVPSEITKITTLLASGQIGKNGDSTLQSKQEIDLYLRETEATKP